MESFVIEIVDWGDAGCEAEFFSDTLKVAPDFDVVSPFFTEGDACDRKARWIVKIAGALWLKVCDRHAKMADQELYVDVLRMSWG